MKKRIEKLFVNWFLKVLKSKEFHDNLKIMAKLQVYEQYKQIKEYDKLKYESRHSVLISKKELTSEEKDELLYLTNLINKLNLF